MSAPSPPPACVPDQHGRCSVCGDVGRVGEVLELRREDSMGRVRMEDGDRPGAPPGRERTVALDLVEGVEPGDRVLVHMGFAIALLREDA